MRTPLTDSDGHLIENVGCRHCGYNLRGLTPSQTCPECETEVGRSVHGDLLQYSDPDWMDEIAAGMRLFVIAIVAGFVIGPILVGTVIAAVLSGGGAMLKAVLVVVILLLLAVMALQLVAYWKITSADPGADEPVQPVNDRTVARYAMILSSVMGMLIMATETVSLNPGTLAAGSPPPTPVLLTGKLVAAALTILGLTALFRYGMSLARRVPDERLLRQTRHVMYGYLITWAIFQVVDLVRPLLAAPVAGMIASFAMLPIMIVGLVYWIWGIVLVFRFRRALRDGAAAAREAWSVPVAG